MKIFNEQKIFPIMEAQKSDIYFFFISTNQNSIIKKYNVSNHGKDRGDEGYENKLV